MVGYIQQQIINIGKKKGFVTTDDIIKYSKDTKFFMNKLIALSYFEEPKDEGTCVKWKFKNE